MSASQITTSLPSTYLQWFEAVKDANIELVQKLHAANPSLASLQYNDQVPYDSLMESEATRLLGADTTKMTALQYGLIHFDAEDEQPQLGRTMDELIDDRKQVIEFLISVSTPDEFNTYRWGANNTALHLASFLGEASIVQQLLAHGAAASLKNSLGQTSKDVALDDETRNAFDQPQLDIANTDKVSMTENPTESTAETKLSVLASQVPTRKTSQENLESRGELADLSPAVFPQPKPSIRSRTNSLPLPFVVLQPKANDAKDSDTKTDGPKPKPKEAIVALRQNLLVSNSVFLNSNSSSPNDGNSSPTSSSPGKRPNYSSANRFSELKLLAESTTVTPAVVSPSASAKTVSPSTPPKRSFTLPSFGTEQEPTKNIKTGRKSETADLAKKSAVRNNPFLRSVEDLTSFSSSHKASHAKVSTSPPSPKKETNKDGSVSPQASRNISPSISTRSISPSTSSGTASPTTSSRNTSPSSSTEVKKPTTIKKDEPKKKQSGISAGISALSQNTLVSNSVFKRRTDSAKPATPTSRGTTVPTTRPTLPKRKSQDAVERKGPEAPVRPMLYKSKSQETVERKKPETPVRPNLYKSKSQEAVTRKEQEVASKERPQQKKKNTPAADSDLNTVLVLEEAKVADEPQNLNEEVVLEPDTRYTSFTNIEDQLPAAETTVTFEDDATVSFAPAVSPLSTSPVNPLSTSPSNSSPRSILRSKGKEAPTAPAAPAPMVTVHRNGSGRTRGSRPKPQMADRRKSVTWNELAEVREIVELIEYEDDGFDSYGSSDDDYMSDEGMDDDDEYHPREQMDNEEEEVEAEERMLKRLNGPCKTVWPTETEVNMSAESSDEEEELIVSRPKEDTVVKEAEPVEAKVNGEQVMDLDILAQGLDDEAVQSNDTVAESIQDSQDEDIFNAIVEKSSESHIQASAPIPIPGAVGNQPEDQTSYFDIDHRTSTPATPRSERSEWTFADVLTNENGAAQARSTRLQRGEVKARLTEWRRSKSYETPMGSPKAPPPVPQLSAVTVMGENDGKKVNGILKKFLNKASGQLKRTNSWSALKTANASTTGIDHIHTPAEPQEPATQTPLDVSEPEQSSASQGDSGRSSFSSSTSNTSVEQEPELRASSLKLSSTVVEQRSPALGPTLSLGSNPAPKQSTSSSSVEQDPELRATSPKLSSTILQQRSSSLSPSPAPIRSSSSSSSASSFDLRRTSASSDSSYSRSPVRSATTSFIDPVLPIGIAKPSPSNSSSSQRGASPNVSPSVSMLPSLSENVSENLHVISEDRNVKNRLSDLVELKKQQKNMEVKQQMVDIQDEEENRDDGEETDVGEDDQEAKVMGYEDDLSNTRKSITSMSKFELEGLRRRDFLLDLPNSNGFERSLLETFDKIVDGKQSKKYVARRTSKVIHASASVEEDTLTSTHSKSPYSKHLPERAFDSQESIGGEYGPTWKVEQDAQRGGTFTKTKRVPSLKPRVQEPTGKLYVRLVSVSDIGVPMSKEPTYVRCVLNDGRYEHFTKYTQLGRNVAFEQEFQIVTRPDSEFSLTLHVRNDQSTKHRPAFARVFSSTRRNIDPLAAYINKEDGAIGQTYIALRDVMDDCRFKVCEATFACVNDWVVELGTKRGSVQRKTKEFMMGKMTVQMFYLPAAEKMTEIPRNLEECKEALSIREWHQNCWHSGHMSQMGGDLNFWRRRHYRLVGSRLLAYHDLHHTPRAAIDLSKAVRLTSDNQVIVGHPGAVKPMNGPVSSGVPRRVSIVSISPSIAVSVNEIDEDLFCAVKKSFRITFYNGEKIDFFCDTDEERGKWVEVLGGIVGKVPVWPDWLTEGREDIVV